MKLRCVSGPIKGQTFELNPQESTVLGREPLNGQNQILLSSKTVSKEHCEVFFDQGCWFVKDLESSNGIRVNQVKVKQGELSSRAILQIGEFTFVCDLEKESTHSNTGKIEKSVTSKRTSTVNLTANNTLETLKSKWRALDFKWKAPTVLVISTLFIFWAFHQMTVYESRKLFIDQAVQTGDALASYLSEVNRKALSEDQGVSVDCSSILRMNSVLAAEIYNKDGVMICPLQGPSMKDALNDQTFKTGRGLNNCEERLNKMDKESCDFTMLISSDQVLGLARVRLKPEDGWEALQSLQGFGMKALLIVLILMLLLWRLVRSWWMEGVETLRENARAVVAGGAQRLENIKTFSDLDELVTELNRIKTQASQAVAFSGEDSLNQAGFLQELLSQVLMVEDRPVMVVDNENHLLHATQTLSGVIPMQEAQNNRPHVTEVVADAHLQTELMGLLNDLSSSYEIIDRPLSMSDRVVHVKGVPIIIHERHWASVLYF